MFGFKKKHSHHVFVLQQNKTPGVSVHQSLDLAQDQWFDWSASQISASDLGTLSGSISRTRLRWAGIILVSVIFLFVGRSAQLQILQKEEYQALSQNNQYFQQLTVPVRGNILDRHGELLAWNEPAFSLAMNISELPKDQKIREQLFMRVAQLTGLQPTDFDVLMAAHASRFADAIPVIEHIAYESALRLALSMETLPGFHLETKTKRIYASSIPSLSHVLGYTGALSPQEYEAAALAGYRLIDDIGKAGIEKRAETLLRGIPGKRMYEVDAFGKKQSIISEEPSLPGENIMLTIDAAFQKFAEQTLSTTLTKVGATKGSVIALDSRTGAIRALVSLPTFDSNEFVAGLSPQRYQELVTNKDQPLFPRAIAGEYPSGSIFKPFVAYAALAEKIVGEHTSFVSNGGVRIGQWFFPDWKSGGHGVTDVRKAIAESVNTYFYIVGGGLDSVIGLGVEKISSYASLFGFGSVTGIDLPGESSGFLPSKEWKQEAKGERWYVGDTYHYAIGQGDFLTTPLQMAVAVAAIANNGNRVIPYVIEREYSKPEPLENLDTQALEIVRQGMRQTVRQGSARSLSNLSQSVAGKTGTAQAPGERPFHSWFIGFGPYEDPSIVLVVLVEEGGESTQAAVPIAKELFTYWFQKNE